MIMKVIDAIKEAVEDIQDLGYVVIPAGDGENIDILWLKKEQAPDISLQLRVLETNPDILGNVLSHRTLGVPLWLTMGYPWDHTREYWMNLRKTLDKHGLLEEKKVAYAKACIDFYRNKRSRSWKEIEWIEPWPLLS